MAGKISARDIEEVKARVNIADVVGAYVALKPASAGSLKGLCPFHQEKSPSFNVRPLQGFYHCFGCGAGGDVYKFLQEMESLSFYEAVENLAGKVGFTLTYEAGAKGPDQGQKARIFEANQAAAKYFQNQLITDAALAGRDFLKSRGFDKRAAELFGVEWKIMVDSYEQGTAITDLKVMKSIRKLIWIPNTGKVSFIDAYGYDIQGAIYQKVVEIVTGKKLPFFIAAITKEKYPDKAVIHLPQDVLNRALEHVEKHIARVSNIKNGVLPAVRCESCDYCRATKKLECTISYYDLC
jgi:hypothetical protein